MKVREIGLKKFGLKNLDNRTALSELENKLLPLYLHHRYQVTATVKMVGGVYYSYSVRTGEAASPGRVFEIVPAADQRAALNSVLSTLDPKALEIPERILSLIPPQAFGTGSQRSELFDKRTSPVFDSTGAAEIAAGFVIDGLLEENRAARLIEFNARDRSNPHFREITAALIKATWNQPRSRNRYHNAIGQTVQSRVVSGLMDLAANDDAAPQVRAAAAEALRGLRASLKRRAVTADSAAHIRLTIDDIDRFLARPGSPRRVTKPAANPPGDPIGN